MTTATTTHTTSLFDLERQFNEAMVEETRMIGALPCDLPLDEEFAAIDHLTARSTALAERILSTPSTEPKDDLIKLRVRLRWE